jgi:GGDEF domain-containing protein
LAAREFVVILTDTARARVVAVAERLRSLVREVVDQPATGQGVRPGIERVDRHRDVPEHGDNLDRVFIAADNSIPQRRSA